MGGACPPLVQTLWVASVRCAFRVYVSERTPVPARCTVLKTLALRGCEAKYALK